MKRNLLFIQVVKNLFVFSLFNLVIGFTAMAQAPVPFGEWRFDDATNLTKASIGSIDLTTGVTGTATKLFTAIAGPSDTDGAVKIGKRSYYKFTHGLTPVAGETKINKYSILFDFRLPATSTDPYTCFYQANELNNDDVELCAYNSQPKIGINDAGYASKQLLRGIWYRIIVVVDNTKEYSVYLDGEKILSPAASTIKNGFSSIPNRFSLDPSILLLGDNNGEDGEVDVARVSFYNAALTQTDVTNIGLIQTATALENVELEDVTILASKKTITINNNNGTALAGIYNLSGTLLKQFEVNSETQSVTLDKAGLYLVTVQKQGKVKTQKVLLTE